MNTATVVLLLLAISVEFGAGVIARRTGRSTVLGGLMWMASILLFMTAIGVSDWISSFSVWIRIPLAITAGWVLARVWLRVSVVISAFLIPFAVPKIGGLYAVADHETYKVYKVLAVNGDAVGVRTYSNRFERIPTLVDPKTLTVGGISLDESSSGNPTSFSVGHISVSLSDFWRGFPVHIQTEPVVDDELHGYREWLKSCESGGSANGMKQSLQEVSTIRIGGLYAVKEDDGSFRIYKVLAVSCEIAISLRKYSNRFEECPTRIDSNELSLGGITLEEMRNGGFDFNKMGIGHYPLHRDGFLKMNPVLIQVEPVVEEELDGYHEWLKACDDSDGDAVDQKKWWHFWKQRNENKQQPSDSQPAN